MDKEVVTWAKSWESESRVATICGLIDGNG